jgi:hypothetical protein
MIAASNPWLIAILVLWAGFLSAVMAVTATIVDRKSKKND